MNRLSLNHPKNLVAILPLLACLGFVPSASAEDALAEAGCELSCPKGFSCAIGPVACLAVFCEDPADCPPCEGPGPAFCAPDACDSDADCAEGALCAERLMLDCPPPAAPAPAAPGYAASATVTTAYECTSSTPNLCTPRWQLPCTLDSDCGSGFLCQEREQVSCDGSAPPANPLERQSAGSAAQAPSPPVICASTFVGACVQIDALCASDTDCPLSMDCVDNGTVCSVTDDEQVECVRQQPERVCRPQVTAGAVGLAASSGESSPASAEAAVLEDAVSSQGGCSMSERRSPASGFGLLTTLGLAALFAFRRR